MLGDLVMMVSAKLGAKAFLCGERPTIADCTLFAALEFASFAGALDLSATPNLARCHESFKKRPSAAV